MTTASPQARLLGAIHTELTSTPRGTGLRPGFEARVAQALADAIDAAPDALTSLMSLIVAVEQELADGEGPAGSSWSKFEDALAKRWRRSGHRARRAAHEQMDTARRRLALDPKAEAVAAKDTDVKSGPLARFALNGPSDKPRRRRVRGRRR